MAISTLKQVRNKNLCLSCIVHCVYNSNYFDFRVVYDSKCPILSPIHTRKRGPVMSSLKTIRYVAREEKLFQTRVRCFQDLPLQNTSPSLEIVHFFPCCTMYYSPLGARKKSFFPRYDEILWICALLLNSCIFKLLGLFRGI